MPITLPRKTCRVTQDEFKSIASEVMGCVFDIHNEFGRMFNESIYKRELQMRIPNVFLEVPILVSYGTFSKVYKVDVMVGDSGLFEFKTVEKLHTRHRGQLLNYLLLLDLAHGKLINLRPQRVEHEFVNCHSRLSNLRRPKVDDQEWRSTIAGAERLRTLFEGLVADWGVGLEVDLYTEALTHLLGGEDSVIRPVSVAGSLDHVGKQLFHCIEPRVGFKLTAVSKDIAELERQYRKLLQRTDLAAIHWINFTHHELKYTTLL